ncbi:MAG TPA: fasciclin domain-containing protein [Methanoculleus sp.]|nr:fasciclin domain-containing protein [Methanoculleus sp.]
MKRWIAPCVCILILLAIPFAVTAALVGDGNATMTPGNVTGNTTGNMTENMTVAGYIAQDQNLTKLAEALNITGFSGMLNSGGPYTVFAPSNDAFNALGNDTVSQLFNDSASLTKVLQYQIVKGEYTSANLTAMAGNQTENQADNASSGGISGIISGLFGGNTAENTTGTAVTLQTLSDESLNVTVSNGVIMVENATVTMKDINTTNGVIQIVDRVLIPPGLNLATTGNATGTAGNTTTA